MISKIVLGTVQLGLPYGINNQVGKPDKQEAMNILRRSLEEGITTLDTANAYGNSREIIGEFHQQNAHSFEVISKCHWKGQDIHKTIIEELQVLNIHHFASYLFHSFDDIQELSPKNKEEFNALLTAGLIQKIGVSVYGNEQFSLAIDNDFISVIQLPYNLLDNDFQKGKLLQLAKDKGKEIHVRSIFLQGLLYMEKSKLPEQLKPLEKHLLEIENIATQNNLSTSTLALGYAIKNKNIDKVLIGVDTLQQLLINIESIKLIHLISDEMMKKISNLAVLETELLNPVNWKK
jgi:aryl-alcohol dehydrogenase-like predicted oxidoreductase